MFSTLIADAQTFLRSLAQNNTRDWFSANKPRYESALRDPALALLEDMAPRLAALTDCPVTPKLFRPYRDVRFSKDKTPYKIHLHMMWTPATRTRQDPALFFGIDPAGVTVATGMPEFTKPVLDDWRKMADLDGAYLEDKIRAATDKGYAPWAPALKRVPAPYGKDHPHGDLLRHKGLVLAGSPDLSGNLPDRLTAAFADIWPVADMLIGVAETPTL